MKNTERTSICIDRPIITEPSRDRYLLYVSCGESLFLRLPDNDLTLRQGDCCLLQPQVIHQARSFPPGQMLRIAFTEEGFSRSFLPFIAGCPLLIRFFSDSLSQKRIMAYLHFERKDHDITSLFLQMEKEQEQHAPYYESVLLCSLISAMVQLTRSYWVHTILPQNAEDDRFSRITSYLLQNYRTATLESTARHFHYHPNTISSLIRKETGDNFSHLLRDIRLKQAVCYLTQTDLSVEEVAKQCGYEHLGNFYRVFKDRYGATPKTYASKHHAAAE